MFSVRSVTKLVCSSFWVVCCGFLFVEADTMQRREWKQDPPTFREVYSCRPLNGSCVSSQIVMSRSLMESTEDVEILNLALCCLCLCMHTAGRIEAWKRLLKQPPAAPHCEGRRFALLKCGASHVAESTKLHERGRRGLGRQTHELQIACLVSV